VTGAFKDVHGRVLCDLDECMATTFEGTIDVTKLWTGEPHATTTHFQRGSRS
jgi:polyisoprenoid-binding protein YceI